MSKILVVDDEEKMQKLLKMILEDEHDVSVASSVSSALQVLKAQPHDVIISDIKMPQEDGLSFLKKLKESDADVPLILITGHGDKKAAIEALRYGAENFIEKPFEDEEIILSVNRALQLRHLRINYQLSIDRLRRRTIELEQLTKGLTTLDHPFSSTNKTPGEKVSPDEKVSGIVHEINNPVSIIGHHASRILDLIKEKTIDPSAIRTAAETIQKMIQRVVTIIRGMRNLSEATHEDPFVQESLSKMIQDTLVLSETRVAQAGIKLEVSEFPSSLKLECRPVQISQVILNLIENACNAIQKLDQKWIRIDVSTSNEFIKLSVTDSGSGIPKENLEKIFLPFFTTKNNGQGTGLGLAICKRLVEAHHGTIEVGTQSQNTQFIVTLPISQKNPK